VLNSGLGTQRVSSGFVAAATGGWWIVVGCGVAVLVLGAVSTGRWARSTTDRAAHLFGDEPQLVSA
jgi:hypothetical protein